MRCPRAGQKFSHSAQFLHIGRNIPRSGQSHHSLGLILAYVPSLGRGSSSIREGGLARWHEDLSPRHENPRSLAVRRLHLRHSGVLQQGGSHA